MQLDNINKKQLSLSPKTNNSGLGLFKRLDEKNTTGTFLNFKIIGQQQPSIKMRCTHVR